MKHDTIQYYSEGTRDEFSSNMSCDIKRPKRNIFKLIEFKIKNPVF